MIKVCAMTWVIFSLLCCPAFAEEYLDITPGLRPAFPRDFSFRKDYRVQWWYFTGHLHDEKGREFGFEITFFVVGIQKREYRSKFGVNSLYISHFAVSDLKGERFSFADRADAGAFGFSGAKEDHLRVWVGENLLEGSMERMHLKALDKDKDLDLVLTPRKWLVLNGEEGYSRKAEESPLFASLYFSYTNMEAAGTLKIGHEAFKVKGKGWFDRELSTRGLSERQKGWDWFSIQLDDNREIMLYLIRNKDGTRDRFSSGTLIYESGRYRRLGAEEFTVKVLDRYTSKKTGARYPSRWEITVPSENIALRVTPLMEDQEFLASHSTGNHYWEGTCEVEGTAKGRAYVEMTGY